MANVLIVDTDGRRRVDTATAALVAGHKTYAAGSISETLRSASIYVPEFILLSTNLPDGTAADLVTAVRNHERRLLREVVFVVPPGLAVDGDSLVYRAVSARADDMVAAIR